MARAPRTCAWLALFLTGICSLPYTQCSLRDTQQAKRDAAAQAYALNDALWEQTGVLFDVPSHAVTAPPFFSEWTTRCLALALAPAPVDGCGGVREYMCAGAAQKCPGDASLQHNLGEWVLSMQGPANAAAVLVPTPTADEIAEMRARIDSVDVSSGERHVFTFSFPGLISGEPYYYAISHNLVNYIFESEPATLQSCTSAARSRGHISACQGLDPSRDELCGSYVREAIALYTRQHLHIASEYTRALHRDAPTNTCSLADISRYHACLEVRGAPSIFDTPSLLPGMSEAYCRDGSRAHVACMPACMCGNAVLHATVIAMDLYHQRSCFAPDMSYNKTCGSELLPVPSYNGTSGDMSVVAWIIASLFMTLGAAVMSYVMYVSHASYIQSVSTGRT